MSEVLVEFDTVLTAKDGTRWVPRACGRVADDGLWEGWIEFLGMADEKQAVRTKRETEQPKRDDLVYWAQGLTEAYLEGALARARDVRPRPTQPVSATPAFSGPAPRPALQTEIVTPRPVLNPYDVYQQGEDILVQELSALATARLRDLVIAYRFATPDDAYGAGRQALTTYIVSGVRQPLAKGRGDVSSETRDAP